MKIIHTEGAPAAIGPYSQAVQAGGMLYCSGQIPLDPKTMTVVEGGIEAQTRRACENLKAVLKAGGSDFSKVVRAGLFLQSMADFAVVNKIYEEYFVSKPARTTIEVARLPKDVLVEIDCIAVVE